MYEVQYGDMTIQYIVAFAPYETLAIEAQARQRAPCILHSQRRLEQYLPALPRQ